MRIRNKDRTSQETNNNPQIDGTNYGLTVASRSNGEGKWIKKPYNYRVYA